MEYVVTFYTKAVQPIKERYKTKKQAQQAMSEDIKEMIKVYKETGYKKIGSVKAGFVSFEHPLYGTDYFCKIEIN